LLVLQEVRNGLHLRLEIDQNIQPDRARGVPLTLREKASSIRQVGNDIDFCLPVAAPVPARLDHVYPEVGGRVRMEPLQAYLLEHLSHVGREIWFHPLFVHSDGVGKLQQALRGDNEAVPESEKRVGNTVQQPAAAALPKR